MLGNHTSTHPCNEDPENNARSQFRRHLTQSFRRNTLRSVGRQKIGRYGEKAEHRGPDDEQRETLGDGHQGDRSGLTSSKGDRQPAVRNTIAKRKEQENAYGQSDLVECRD